MRNQLVAAAAAAALSFFLVPNANAMTVGAASGIQQSFAETNMIEQVVRVCRTNVKGRRVCHTDRSRPPTVCHRIRGTNRMDCY